MTDFCVELRNVDKSFVAESKVLDGVSLEFPAGRTTAVVGASGSGKTTLLQLINAVLSPDAGEVRVFGEPVPRQALVAHRRRIGYSVQGAGLFPHLTNRANVTLLARLEGWSAQRIAHRCEALFGEMELPADVAERYPHELSGGQQQRVGLCRALMLEPRLLLLDEPFSAIDPITRLGIYEHFVRIQKELQISTLLVTHDMREAVRLADFLVILRQGKVLQAAAPARIIEAPVDDYVAMLVREQL
jgi:osmoprotectant transport system ATP-binding protein